jgi:NADH:ubiquinone oxidoreductase subunit E
LVVDTSTKSSASSSSESAASAAELSPIVCLGACDYALV